MKSSWHFLFMNIYFICHNGKMISNDQPVLVADNRSFKYGDGVFETMKWKKKVIVLSHYHFERLFSSLRLLQINSQFISTDVLLKGIAELCELNNCTDLARIRLAVYRGENSKTEYLIEAIPVENTIGDWNKKGWAIYITNFEGDNVAAGVFIEFIDLNHTAKWVVLRITKSSNFVTKEAQLVSGSPQVKIYEGPLSGTSLKE